MLSACSASGHTGSCWARLLNPMSRTDRIAAPSLRSGVRDASRPAIMMGGDASGLGVARSLGGAGAPVIVVESDPHLPAMHSRYVRPCLVDGSSGLPLINGLLALRTQLPDNPVLFPTYHYRVYTEARRHHRGRRHRCELGLSVLHPNVFRACIFYPPSKAAAERSAAQGGRDHSESFKRTP